MKNSIDSLKRKYHKFENMDENELLKKSLLKKATGFVVEEIVEEFDLEENLKPVKRKVVAKEIPPDANVIKFLLEFDKFSKNDYSLFSDEELNNEKNRLLNLLKEDESL